MRCPARPPTLGERMGATLGEGAVVCLDALDGDFIPATLKTLAKGVASS